MSPSNDDAEGMRCGEQHDGQDADDVKVCESYCQMDGCITHHPMSIEWTEGRRRQSKQVLLLLLATYC